ncbi:hypothetical protein C0J52_11041 [Blattella germanica]|nr:hypothetical protein C0J52_11041 [Blattella germanica]
MTLTDLHPVDAYCEGVMDPSLYDQMLPSLGGYSSESSMFPIATEEDPWDSPICSYESTAKDKVLDLPTYTVNWILKVAQENGLECEEIHNFRDVDGCRLKYMNEELFYRLEPNCGRALYRAMQNLKLEQGHPGESLPEDKRPRKGKDHDNGIFRFVHSEKVARLWGTLKENPKMTYEKLSRAMRYYYKSKVLQPVLGRRLVYKFGPTATGWRTPNPNFKNKDCVKSKL